MPQTILVVDDERDILELVRFNLAQAGFRVFTASDGTTCRLTLAMAPNPAEPEAECQPIQDPRRVGATRLC